MSASVTQSAAWQSRLAAVRDEAIDCSVALLAALSLPTVALLVLRATIVGWRPGMAVAIGLAGVLCGTYLARGRLPAAPKAGVALATLCVAALDGLLSFGLASYGAMYLVALVLLATLLLGPRWGVRVLGAAVALACALIVAVAAHQLRFSVDLNAYNTAPVAWLGLPTTLAFLAGTLLAVGGKLYSALAEELRVSEGRAEALARANAELARANAEWETLLRVLPIGIGIADDPGVTHIRMNPASARMLGLPVEANASLGAPEGERPTSYRMLRHGRELALEELPLNVAAATGQEVRDLELEVVRQDGARLTELAYAAPLRDERGRVRGAVGAYLDISARVRAERQRDLLFAGMAHDLKNQLAALAWLAELLRRRAAEPDDEGILERFVQGARQLMGQTSALLHAARAEPGRPPGLERRPVDLAALARRLAAEQAGLSPGRRIRVEGAEGPLPGLADEALLGRALANVLGNALKYSAPGQEVTVTLARAAGARGGWASIRVADRGIGIPAAELGRVFEPYYRASNAPGRAGGSGLGLAGVRQVVEAHGGSVELESEEGAGTTVTIRLPLRPPERPDSEEEGR